jgi:hypothetical protein
MSQFDAHNDALLEKHFRDQESFNNDDSDEETEQEDPADHAWQLKKDSRVDQL